MPNTSSAKKALRQTVRRTARNKAQKRELKTYIKNYKKAVDGGEMEKAGELLQTTYKKLDKAAKINLIKPNKASRLKSRLSLYGNKAKKDA